MTDDELDLLASAYLDGEATSEEVDMVERDPALLARVEAMRAIGQQVATPVTGPSAEVKEQHLAAALAAFGTTAGTSDAETANSESSNAAAAPVIDLAERASKPRRSSAASKPATQSRTMPRWLPAAAALMLFGGAAAVIASQGLGGGDDATDTAAMETESAEDSAEAADFDASAARAETQVADDAADDASTEELAGGSGDEEEAMEEEAMEDDEAMEDEAEADAASSAPAQEGDGGFFPRDPVLFFDAAPDPDQVLQQFEPDLRTNVTQSECGDFAAPLTDGSVLGYVPIEVAGEAAELFLLARENGTESAVILTLDGCLPLAP